MHQRVKIFLDKYSIYGIFVLAFLIRIIYLPQLPWGFHIDEVVSGYIGRFVLLHGKDIYGNTFPLFYFDTFGDYRVILPMYINGLSSFFFGVNEFAVRFPAAVFGALAVFPVYRIALFLFQKSKIALLPAILLTIIPWHIVLSRANSEGIIGLTIFLFGIQLLLSYLLEKKKYVLFPSVLLLFSTYFLYPTFRVLVPLVIFPFIFFPIHKKQRWMMGILFIVFILITILVYRTPWGKGRYLQTSLFSSPEVASRIQSENTALDYGEGNNNIFVSRFFHNKIVGYTQELFDQYFSYFSPDFIFVSGGLPYRYDIPNVGLLYVTLTLLLFGILLPETFPLNTPLYVYVLYLLLIAPIPAALTVDDIPNMHRVLFLMIPLLILMTVGFKKILLFLTAYKSIRMLFLLIFFSCLSVEFIYFMHQYSVQAASVKSVLRNQGNKEIISLITQYPKTDHIYITVYDGLPIYYLFFTNNFDKKYIGAFQSGLIIKQIENVTFIPDSCPSKTLTLTSVPSHSIIIDTGECPENPNYKQLSQILRKDSTIAYKILVLDNPKYIH